MANELLIAASRMTGIQRRVFLAEVCQKLCAGNTRQAERRFGWGRNTIAKGIAEQRLDPDAAATRKSGNAGKKRSEEQNPRLAVDIRLIVEPHTHTDPELKTERRYTNLSAAEVRQTLLDRGYSEGEVPSERTMRDILNRMNYRLKRIQKGKPLKKTKDTNAMAQTRWRWLRGVRLGIRDSNLARGIRPLTVNSQNLTGTVSDIPWPNSVT